MLSRMLGGMLGDWFSFEVWTTSSAKLYELENSFAYYFFKGIVQYESIPNMNKGHAF